MRPLDRGAEVTTEYLTDIFKKMYQKVNAVPRLYRGSTGQYITDSTMYDGVSTDRVVIMEPMSATSEQYYDRPKIEGIHRDPNLTGGLPVSYDYLAWYTEDIETIKNL
jgi:hypothetical protein